MPSSAKIVVTGANGQLGQLVAQALLPEASRVTLGSRDPQNLAELAARGFATTRVDFDDPASLDAAFAGADTVLIISASGRPEERAQQHRRAIDAAQKAGVKRVVYTSFTNPTPQSRFSLGAAHVDSEAYLKASGLPYTIVRNNQYAENLDGTLAGSKESNTLFVPGVNGKVAYITRADIAAALAAVVTQDGHQNRVYELTGSEALSVHEIAQVLSTARGASVNVVDADPAEYAKTLASYGLPDWLVDGLIGMYAASDAGEYAAVSTDAATLLGRPAESMSAYARRFA